MVLDSCIVISFSQGELTILNSFLLFLITTTTVIILSTKMTEQGCTITHGGPELLPESITDDTETEYDYKYLCMPRNPWSKTKQKPLRFYGKDEAISSPLALLMGLQHAFAMIGGLITPPLVIFRYSIDFQDTELQQYAVAAALITSGITSLINIFQFPIPFSEKIFGRKLFLGSGVLSVLGTSFTFVPIFDIAISDMMNDGVDGRTAYGRMLGTAMVCSLIEIIFSLAPPAVLKTIFPPIVSSVTVMLLGIYLIGGGMKQWGGGSVCADMGWKEHVQAREHDIDPFPSPMCQNGNVSLGYGSPQFIGLGFSVIVFLLTIELFGSPFMTNCNVILALLFGYMIAGISTHKGDSYVDTSPITDAPALSFLWTETFPLGFYAPAVIPCLLASLVSTVETVADITATYESSKLDVDTEEYEQSLQGGLFSDAFNSVLAGLFTSMPNTTFSQNNGIIRVTKCASKRAGYACGAWLIVMGVLGKLGGVIASIPDAVLGGMTIFLFSQIFISGLTLASSLDLESRRVKFILSMSMAIGVGVTVWPYAFQDRTASPYTANFWRCDDCSDALKGLRNGVSIFLSTGYCIGAVVAMSLNAILPFEAGDEEETNPKVARNSNGERVTEEEDEDSTGSSAGTPGTSKEEAV